MPPHALALYFKLCALIRARKWSAAYAVAHDLDVALRSNPN
jgi:hypothetical protein